MHPVSTNPFDELAPELEPEPDVIDRSSTL